MKKAKIYYGWNIEEERTMFATVTGQMSDGTLVYTEVEQGDGGEVIIKNGSPKLLLDKQYLRRLKTGSQTFWKL